MNRIAKLPTRAVPHRLVRLGRCSRQPWPLGPTQGSHTLNGSCSAGVFASTAKDRFYFKPVVYIFLTDSFSKANQYQACQEHSRDTNARAGREQEGLACVISGAEASGGHDFGQHETSHASDRSKHVSPLALSSSQALLMTSPSPMRAHLAEQDGKAQLVSVHTT